jgi:hypothetical protein
MAHHGTGGLQKHSIGADYPYIMVATQRHGAGPLQWMVMDGATGNLSQRFSTSQAARIHLTSLRLRNCMHS